MSTSEQSINGIDATEATINDGDKELLLRGQRLVRWRYWTFWCGVAATAGVLYLVSLWWHESRNLFIHKPCKLAEADSVLVRTADGELNFCRIIESNESTGNECGSESSRYFVYKKLRYFWNSSKLRFERLDSLAVSRPAPCSTFHSSHGLSDDQAVLIRARYGSNTIKVEVTPIFTLISHEVIQPFYLFQLASILLCCLLEYYIFGVCLMLMSLFSISLVVIYTRKMQRALKETVRESVPVTVIRPGNQRVELDSTMLVPGDVIELPSANWVAPCDAVLVSGTCIVSEAMLTGESDPVTKTPVPNARDEHFSLTHHVAHILYSGTLMVQSKRIDAEAVRAVVLRTGFLTWKGELVRSLLFAKPYDFKFQRHSYYFILVLAVVGLATAIYLVVVFAGEGIDAFLVFLWALSMITIVVPPVLPAALTISVYFGQQRLKAKGIYCVGPKRILVSGAINTVCFDKTGTLTEDTLDITGIQSCSDSIFAPLKDVREIAQDSALFHTLTTCHSLVIIDGTLRGDPLEIRMFEATGWKLMQASEDDASGGAFTAIAVPPHCVSKDMESLRESTAVGVAIVRQFAFSSNVMRMSVITLDLAKKSVFVHCKGAPEIVSTLCRPETVPGDLQRQLEGYTKQGYRVIALAWKALDGSTLDEARKILREEAEHDLVFAGLLVTQNRLKPQTAPTIRKLHVANVRVVMVTGDNLLTAVTVARECGLLRCDEQLIEVDAHEAEAPGEPAIVSFYLLDAAGSRTLINANHLPHRRRFALTGSSWIVLNLHFRAEAAEVALNGAVFARMSPEQKAQLVESIKALGQYVVMCGDGANDCGALKAAHAGISLSDAEASVASPFTSKVRDIRCVVTLIKEGRASLVGTFGIFKLMILYAIAQLTATVLVLWNDMLLSPYQYLWQDLFQTTTFVATSSLTKPAKFLVSRKPCTSLIGFKPLCETIFHSVLIFVTQTIAFVWVSNQPWCFSGDWRVNRFYSHQNRIVWELNILQIVSSAIVVAHSAPHRRSIFSNKAYLINLLVIGGVTVYLCIEPAEFFTKLFEILPVPSLLFRIDIVLMALANFQISYIFERFICENEDVKCWLQACSNKIRSGSLFHFRFVTPQFSLSKMASGSSNQAFTMDESAANSTKV